MRFQKFRAVIAVLSALCIFLCSCSGTESSGSDDSTYQGDFDAIIPVAIPNPLPENALPDFSSYFAPHGVVTKIKVPGGSKLPAIGAKAGSNVPVISEFSDLTYGDETIAITGDNLAGATLTVWAEGILKDVTPLRTDNSKMQVVLPKEAGKSMMIIWPKNKNGVGTPVRVNAPEVWWTNAEVKTGSKLWDSFQVLHPEDEDKEICLYGSALSLEGKTPLVLAVHENGKQETLEVKDANPYQIRVSYPKSLTEGKRCKIYVHNGTGGAYGWSDAVFFNVEKKTTSEEKKLKEFKVDDFGAKVNDGQDDSVAINKALAEAAKEGGGIVRFGKGEYNINSTIKISDEYPKGLVFCGVGEGKYDFKSSLAPSEYEMRGVSGTYTIIRFVDPSSIPTYMLHVDGNNVSVRDMTINGGEDGVHNKFNVFVHGENIAFNKVRFIKSDVRDFTQNSSADLVSTTNLEIDNYSKNITVKDCEFHSKSSGISIANIEGIWPWGYFDGERTVKNVLVDGCDFYGYTSPYKSPKGKRPRGDEGMASHGITAINLDGGVFTNNTFQGYDRENLKLLVRGFCFGLPTKHTYVANNTFKNVGNYPGSGYDTNSGEQILYHGQDAIGSIFEVVETKGNDLTITTEGIEMVKNGQLIKPADTTTNAGSTVPEGFDLGAGGAVFICSGKGAGQVRNVTAYDYGDDTITFTLDEPFAIDPDSTSIVTLTAPFMENIIYNNSIGNDKPTLSFSLKTGGVLMFYQSCDTIIANNDIHNMSFGVSLNSTFKMPTYWTTVRDNVLSGITEINKDAMQGGDTTLDAAFFCDSVRGNAGESAGWDKYNVWYALGNVFRNNKCSNGDVAGELVTNRWNLTNPGLNEYFGEEKGNTMSIYENNTFNDVAQGITIGNPAYWSLIRNNTFTFKNKAGYVAKEIHNYNPFTNFKLLYIVNDKIERDDNNTANK